MEELARWWGAVTPSTSISAAIAMLSAWVVFLERKEKSLVWRIGFGIALLGIIGVVVSIRDELKNQADSASRSSIMSEVDRRRLVERLSELPADCVNLVFDTHSDEAGDFGVTMSEILHDAGCLREQKDFRVLGGNAGTTGLWVMYSGKSPGPFATKLHDALAEAGLPGVKYSPSAEPMMGDHVTTLVVLRKRHDVAAPAPDDAK